MKHHAFIVPSLLLLAALGAAQELPVRRLAGVAFRVGDVAKARQFYVNVMGYEEAFDLKSCAFFRVNEDQYLEFCPGLTGTGGGAFQLDHVSLLTPSIEITQRFLREEKLEPGAIWKQEDRNLHFSIADPDGTTIDFVQYAQGSPQTSHRRKSLEARPVSDHLLHAGLAMSSEAAGMAFYRDQLGFREFLRGGPTPGEIRWINLMMPGVNGDYVELMVHAADPVTARQHLCFEVTDIQAAYKLLLERGMPNTFKPFLAQNHHWIMNFRDPYGIRIEMMEKKLADSK